MDILKKRENTSRKDEKIEKLFDSKSSKIERQNSVEIGSEEIFFKRVGGWIKELLFTKGLLYFFLFIAVMIFFIWMWFGFFRNSDPDFKKDFEKSFLPTNSTASQSKTAASSQASSAASQAAASSQQMQSSNPALNNPTPESTSPTENNPTTEEQKKEENKKFESKTLGFSLEYPDGTAVSESGDTATVTKDSVSWKIKFYENKNKKDFQAWYTDHFDIKDSTKCTFAEGTVKAGSYESKSVKPSAEGNKCDGDGNYTISSDKSKVVKVELGKETAENANKILANFKFTE